MTKILLNDEPYNPTYFNRYLIENNHSYCFDYLYDYGKGYFQQIMEPTYVVSLSAQRYGVGHIECYGFSIMYEELFNLSMLNIINRWLKDYNLRKEWFRLWSQDDSDEFHTTVKLLQVTNLALCELDPTYGTYTPCQSDKDFVKMLTFVGETLNAVSRPSLRRSEN